MMQVKEKSPTTLNKNEPRDVNGKLHGIRREYDSKGGLQTLSTYQHGLLNGKYLIWRDGVLQNKRYFYNGMKHGKNTFYPAIDGIFKNISASNYVDNMLHGVIKKNSRGNMFFKSSET